MHALETKGHADGAVSKAGGRRVFTTGGHADSAVANQSISTSSLPIHAAPSELTGATYTWHVFMKPSLPKDSHCLPRKTVLCVVVFQGDQDAEIAIIIADWMWCALMSSTSYFVHAKRFHLPPSNWQLLLDRRCFVVHCVFLCLFFKAGGMQKARPKAHAPVTSTTDPNDSKKAPMDRGGGVGEAVPHRSSGLQVTSV